MKDMSKLPGRVDPYGFGAAALTDPHNGAAIVKVSGAALRVVFSDRHDWDHVSVSLAHRCPTWDEMHAIKELFFDPEDVVVQFHPRASEYRNLHPYCLHLWRCQRAEFPRPAPHLVAP